MRLEDLKAFLRAHPGALDEDGELISLLTPPAFRRGHNVLDMQSFMIARLKTQAAERAAREVKIKRALVADTLEERRLEHAVLAIVGARGFERLIETITRTLPQILAATRVTLNIERPTGAGGEFALLRTNGAGPIRIIPPGTVARLTGREDATYGVSPRNEALLFSADEGPIRSYLAVRLSLAGAAPPGLLAIGARGAKRFGRSTGIHRYVFLAHIIEQSIRLWLDLPPE